MADILIFDPNSTPVANRVTGFLRSQDTGQYSARTDVLINPVLPNGVLLSDLKVVAGNAVAMSQAEKDSIVSAAAMASLAALKAAAKANIDASSDLGRVLQAIVGQLTDEVNAVRIVAVLGLGQRTLAQVKADIKSKIDALP